MTVNFASRLSVAALALFAVFSSWHATLAVPGLTA
jgi:hypothetical protein